MAEQKRIAAESRTAPAMKAKALDSMIARVGSSAVQTARLISAKPADPVERLFKSILEDPNGLASPQASPTPSKAFKGASKVPERPVDAMQKTYDRLALSHVPTPRSSHCAPATWAPSASMRWAQEGGTSRRRVSRTPRWSTSTSPVRRPSTSAKACSAWNGRS